MLSVIHEIFKGLILLFVMAAMKVISDRSDGFSTFAVFAIKTLAEWRTRMVAGKVDGLELDGDSDKLDRNSGNGWMLLEGGDEGRDPK